MMNDVQLTALLRETYMPLIHKCLEGGPPMGEMRWLVNKCGTQFNRIKRHGRKPVTSSLMVTINEPHDDLSPKRWCSKFVNARSGNVYFISFEAEENEF